MRYNVGKHAFRSLTPCSQKLKGLYKLLIFWITGRPNTFYLPTAELFNWGSSEVP